MTFARLPPREYYAKLPKHIVGAGAIIRDAEGQVLLVKPAYRDDTWEIPGGGLEPGEDPLQAVARELREELGRTNTPGRLLAVDWIPEQPDGRPPLLNFVFDGGLITQNEIDHDLQFDHTEVTECRLTSATEWQGLLLPHLARRLRACARALADERTLYLQQGVDPFRWP
jgi:8-oxo-dGTP pyrophosphatase MutT (NUDIX family)